MIEIRNIQKEDEADSFRLRKQLWPSCSQERHLLEMKLYSSSMDKCALLAFEGYGAAIGFCECSLRNDYVEAATGSPTAYLEGIFVAEPFRKLGIAKKLIDHA